MPYLLYPNGETLHQPNQHQMNPNHDLLDQRGIKKKERKNKNNNTLCLWPFLKIFNLDQFDLHHWLEIVPKHLITLLESKKLKSNQI
jgi:hypothetical protein